MRLFQLLMFGSLILARAVVAAVSAMAAVPSQIRRRLSSLLLQRQQQQQQRTSGGTGTNQHSNKQHGELHPATVAAALQLHPSSSSSSITASILNLVNNVAGAGLLTLPASQALAQTGYIPAVAIAVIIGALSAHTFILIGVACELTAEHDFKVRAK
jgi:Transmembrane amino acid transporter protein